MANIFELTLRLSVISILSCCRRRVIRRLLLMCPALILLSTRLLFARNGTRSIGFRGIAASSRIIHNLLMIY